MSRKVYYVLVFGFICVILDEKMVESKRTFASTSSTEAQTAGRSQQYDSSEDLLTPPQFNSARTAVTPKPSCSPNCYKTERRKRKQAPTRKKPDSSGYKESKRSSPSRNESAVEFPKKKKIKFSRKYDPSGNPEDNGFVPVPGPYGIKTTPRSAQRRARIRNPDELIVKESRQSPNILGNGNFEIIRGGIYSDDESNEIGEGRRMGRGYDSYNLPPFQQIPFNVQNFQFPSFYQGRLQVPTHPMYFPRAAY